jgi:hypothetical protein
MLISRLLKEASLGAEDTPTQQQISWDHDCDILVDKDKKIGSTDLYEGTISISVRRYRKTKRHLLRVARDSIIVPPEEADRYHPISLLRTLYV